MNIHPSARIGERVEIAEGATICADAVIGDDCVIEPHCIVGYSNGRECGPLVLGNGAHVRSHSVLYAGSDLGANLVTGHFAVIRENCMVGAGFQCGTKTVLMGELTVGEFVRTGSNVELGQGSTIGDYSWIYINASLLNDRYPPSEDIRGPIVGRFSIVGAHALLFPGVEVGEDALVAAGASVTRSVESGMLVAGNPARPVGPLAEVLRGENGERIYPWRERFERGYPPEVVRRWAEAR